MKQISQQFFDETVRANLELLDQSMDEAIEETIQSFTIEGVDLSNIIPDKIKHADGHPCENCYKSLVSVLNEATLDCMALETCLDEIERLSAIDLAHRKSIASQGAFKHLEFALKKCMESGERRSAIHVIKTTSALLVGQPELIREDGEDYLNRLTELLTKTAEAEVLNAETLDLLSELCHVLRVACLMNEPNRTRIAQSLVPSKTVDLLSRFELKTACTFLRSLTLDDDMSVEFGEGSANARSMASAGTAIEVLTKLAKDALSISSETCVADVFLALSSVITRDEFCRKFTDLEGMDIIFQTLLNYMNSAALELHMSDAATVRAICMAIRNCVSRSQDLRAAFLGQPCKTNYSVLNNSSSETGDVYELEALLNSALRIRGCADEAKAALRDLGCRVQLQERWRGNPPSTIRHNHCDNEDLIV
ncbi:Armadillo repeat-containing protein 6 [Clonorchis sinensis]|uniref:Armadillo repeat-containing protein 6 n=1 Tax=Clonorchis sinensis TaxID=79923 RepID=A0A8T1MPB0_CLOSI|nr:Armadillo repeat-containing protein 6 [Clonorchis sinensis]